MNKKNPKPKKMRPMVPKTAVKPKAMGGGKYGCGGKLK